MTRRLQRVSYGLLILCSGFCRCSRSKARRTDSGELYASETGSTGYSPLDQINRDNVKNLQVAWSWKFDNFGNTNTEVTPHHGERRSLLPLESFADHHCGGCRNRPDVMDVEAPARRT